MGSLGQIQRVHGGKELCNSYFGHLCNWFSACFVLLLVVLKACGQPGVVVTGAWGLALQLKVVTDNVTGGWGLESSS